MKIGLVIYGSLDTISGGYLYDRMLVSHLRDRGDDVEIISLPTVSYGLRLLHNLWFKLDRAFDVVLQDELCHPSLLAENARQRGFPVVSIVHNVGSVRTGLTARPKVVPRHFEQQYLREVDGFIFNSQTTRKSVTALVGDRKPFVIAPPGGDRLGEILPQVIEARAHQGEPLRLVFLANVVPGKGLDVALEALQRLRPSAFQLDVVGSCDVEPAYARRMQRRAAVLRLPVHFHGPLDGESLKGILEQAHVLVLPSYYEGFGIAALEAMAHGLPVLSTTAGAIPELVSSGINGFLIQPGDGTLLADLLDRFSGDRGLLANMGLAAFRNYQSRPTWQESAELIRDFLVEIAPSPESKSAKHEG